MADGVIPVKYKERMALAVAFTTQCPYCIEIHSGRGHQAGVTGLTLGIRGSFYSPAAKALLPSTTAAWSAAGDGDVSAADGAPTGDDKR
jgi:AhpD family alkylhydroperoxidase